MPTATYVTPRPTAVPTPGPTPTISFQPPTPTPSATYVTPRQTAVPAPVSTPTFEPPPPPPRPTYTTYQNQDIEGGDLPGSLPHFRDVDQSACEMACNDNSQCLGYSYGKWDRACYLKSSLPNLRFEPNSIAVIRRNQLRPPEYLGSRKIEATKRNFVGNRYSTSSVSSRQACSDLCQRDDVCVGYQYAASSCWRYNQIDFATKDDTAQAGVKRQIPR
jgi:hypothetical protein